MSSSSRSSTATSTSNADNRVAADNGSIVVRDGSVQVTDGGAFDLAQNVTDEAFSAAEGIAEIGGAFAFDALGFVQSNQQETNRLVGAIIDQQRDETTQLSSQLVRFGIPALVIIIIARGWMK